MRSNFRMRSPLIGFVFLACSVAKAELGAIINTAISTDNFKEASTTSTGLNYTGFVLMMSLDKKKYYYLGYHYGSISQTATAGGTTGTFASTDLGPFLVAYFNRSRTISGSIGYNLQSTAKYNDGVNTPVEWSGTSMHIGLGLEQEISDGIWLGMKITSYSMSYSRDVTLGATATSISYTRQWLTPLISLSFR